MILNVLIVIGILAIIVFGLIMGTIGCAAVFMTAAMIWSWLKDAFLIMVGKPTWR